MADTPQAASTLSSRRRRPARTQIPIDREQAYPSAGLVHPAPLQVITDHADERDRKSLQRFDWRRQRAPNRVLTRGYNLESAGDEALPI